MSKLVAHISGTGQQGRFKTSRFFTLAGSGKNVLNHYIQDEHTSADTRAWLNDFADVNRTSKKITRCKAFDSIVCFR